MERIGIRIIWKLTQLEKRIYRRRIKKLAVFPKYRDQVNCKLDHYYLQKINLQSSWNSQMSGIYSEIRDFPIAP